MAVKYKDIAGNDYSVQDQNDVHVETKVGDGQPVYSISVFLDKENKGMSENVKLGKPSEVRNKLITIVVVVQDRLAETNWTSFTSWLVQGNSKIIYGPYSEEANQDQDTVIYTLKIKLK